MPSQGVERSYTYDMQSLHDNCKSRSWGYSEGTPIFGREGAAKLLTIE